MRPEKWFTSAVKLHGIEVLPITEEIAIFLPIPLHHRDPLIEMIIAYCDAP